MQQIARIGISITYRTCAAWHCFYDLNFVRLELQRPEANDLLRPLLKDDQWSLPYRFPDPRWLQRLDRIARLSGRARLVALGRLDLDLSRKAIPAVALYADTSRQLVSRRVGCFRFHRVYEVDLAALCLKG